MGELKGSVAGAGAAALRQQEKYRCGYYEHTNEHTKLKKR